MSKLKVDVLETVDGSKSVNVSALGTASAVSNTPAGGIAATTVQDAINELDAEKFSKSGGSISGNVSFTGSGRRIAGAFGGVPVANRTLFQTTVANDSTTVGIIPNGTSNTAYLQFSNSSDPDNGAYGYIGFSPSSLVLTSTALGSGTKLPISIDGRLSIGLDGAVLATGGSLGYGAGSGGTVTQVTNKGTTVTLHKICGTVTTHNQEMVAGQLAVFDVLNTLSTADTVAVACIDAATPNYWEYTATATVSGGGRVTIFLEKRAGTTNRSDNVVIKFALLRISST